MRRNEENLHANVVIHVVHVSLVPPPRAHRRRQHIANLTMRIRRDDMRRTQDRGWVEKPKSVRVIVGHKADTVKATSREAAGGSHVPPVPAHPENVKFLDPVG